MCDWGGMHATHATQLELRCGNCKKRPAFALVFPLEIGADEFTLVGRAGAIDAIHERSRIANLARPGQHVLIRAVDVMGRA